ncbi:hypothetical protein B0F90DRAFT_1675352, partial [Multifurca ochricompacta]
RGRRRLVESNWILILGMTTMNFSMAIPNSRNLLLQRCPPPSLLSRYPQLVRYSTCPFAFQRVLYSTRPNKIKFCSLLPRVPLS